MNREAIMQKIEAHRRSEAAHRQAREALEKKLEEPGEWKVKEPMIWNGVNLLEVTCHRSVLHSGSPLSKAIAEYLAWMLNDIQKQPSTWSVDWCDELGELVRTLHNFNQKEAQGEA